MNFQNYLNSQTKENFMSSYLFNSIDKKLYNQILNQMNSCSPIDCYKKNPDAFVEIILSIYNNIVIQSMNRNDLDIFVDYLIKDKNIYSLIESLYKLGDDLLNNKLLDKLSSLLTSKILKVISTDPVILFKGCFLEAYAERNYSQPILELLDKNEFSQNTLHNLSVFIILQNKILPEVLLEINKKLDQKYLIRTYIILIDSIYVDNLKDEQIKFYSCVLYDMALKLNFTYFKETVVKLIAVLLLNKDFNFYTIPFIKKELQDPNTNFKKTFSYNNDDFMIFIRCLFHNHEVSSFMIKEIFTTVPQLFKIYIPFFNFDIFKTFFHLLSDADIMLLINLINQNSIHTNLATIYIQSIYKLAEDNRQHFHNLFLNNIKQPHLLELINMDYELQNF